MAKSDAPELIVAAGDSGTILTISPQGTGKEESISVFSADGGDIFSLMRSKGLFCAALCDRSNGRPYLLRSANGTNWSAIQLPVQLTSLIGTPRQFSEYSRVGFAADTNRIIAISSDGKSSFVSTNAGTSWAGGGSLAPPLAVNMLPGYYSDFQTSGQGSWVALGSGGVISVSTNGGANWSKVTAAAGSSAWTPHSLQTDGKSYIAAWDPDWTSSAQPQAYRSSNGLSWTATLTSASLGLSDISVRNILGSAGSFIAIVHGQNSSGVWDNFAYTSRDGGVTWKLSPDVKGPFDFTAVRGLASTSKGLLYAFGAGGLIAKQPAGAGEFRLVSQPFLGINIYPFETTAGVNGVFMGLDALNSGRVYSLNGTNFLTEFFDNGWIPGSKPTRTAKAISLLGGGFVSANLVSTFDPASGFSIISTSLGLETSTDGMNWKPLAGSDRLQVPTANSFEFSFPLGVAVASTNGPAIALVMGSDPTMTAAAMQRLSIYVWNKGSWVTNVANPSLDLSFPAGPTIWNFVKPKIAWDGRRFLLLSPKGKLFSSTNAINWTPLSSLPSDTADYVSQSFASFGIASTNTNNVVSSFALGNGVIVVRPAKLPRTVGESVLTGGPDRFFVLAAGATNWTKQQPSLLASDWFDGNDINYNGSIFASANYAGRLWTSPDGTNWTRRELGADVKSLTWDGKQFVGLTAYGSVITHPTGLSAVALAAHSIRPFAVTNNVPFGTVLTLTNTNSTAGLPVSFAVVSGPGVMTNGNQLRVTGSTGSVTVRATVASNANYNAVTPLTNSFTTAKATQTITFTNLPGTNTFRSNGVIPLRATASSGLAVTYTSANTNVLQIVGGTNAVMKRPGTNTITASQPGNENFLPASNVTRTIVIR